MKIVSVNLLNKDQKDYLGSCIDSVLNQSYLNLEIIIIDNSSTDGSAELIKEEYPQLKLIQNNSNEGYAKAHNKGIDISQGEYIMPLNVDLILTETFIEEMVKAIEKKDEIGMAQGKLYRLSGISKEKIFDSAGIFINKFRRNFDRGYGQIDRGQYNKIEYIFATSGAAPLYRRKMLEDIKVDGEYFDEDFFMYRDEVDIAWRAQLLGWKCIYTPDAVAYHIRGYAPYNRQNVPKPLRRLQYRNRYLMIVKNELLSTFLPDFIFIFWFEVCLFLYCFFREPFLLESWVDIVRLFPRMLCKRRQIMGRKKVGDLYILNMLR